MEVSSCAIISTCFGALVFYFLTIESPRYLHVNGRITDAHNIWRKMAAINQKERPSGTLVCDQMAESDEEFTPLEDAHLLSTGKKNIAVYKQGFSSLLMLCHRIYGKGKMRKKMQKNINDINYFVNRQLIYNFLEELFVDAGVLAIKHADFDGIEQLPLVTGGEIASTFNNPESVKLGHCKLIKEIMIGEDKSIHFSRVEMGKTRTIVLRGAMYCI